MFTTWLHRIISIFNRNGKKGILDLDAAFAEAHTRSEETFTPPHCESDAQLIILKRVWHKVHPDSPIPDDFALFRLIPSGLKEEAEIDSWFYGCGEEAKRAYQIALNTSWSKTELVNKLASECLDGALGLFDSETQRNIEHDVIRMLSD